MPRHCSKSAGRPLGHKGAEAHVVQREAKETWFAQPGEEMVSGEPILLSSADSGFYRRDSVRMAGGT